MIVLDASAAMEIIEGSPEGRGLQSLMFENERVISVDFYTAEMGNVIRRMRRYKHFGADEANSLMSSALQLVDEIIPLNDLVDEAFQESIRLDHPLYDMLYFVLARRTAGILFTLDRQLIELCADHGVNSIDLVTLPNLWEED